MRAFLVTAILLSAVPAGAETILCQFDPGRHRSYIASEIEITRVGLSEARVSDAIIASTGRRAVTASVDELRSGRLRIVWELSEVARDPKESRRGPVKLSMRLSVDTSDGVARLEVQDLLVRRYSYRAQGQCEF